MRGFVEVVEQMLFGGEFGGAVAVVEAGRVLESAETGELFEAAQVVQQRGPFREGAFRRIGKLRRRDAPGFIADAEGVVDLEPDVPVVLRLSVIKGGGIVAQVLFQRNFHDSGRRFGLFFLLCV